MNETSLLIVFIAVTSVAVVLQTLILAGLYFSVRRMMERTQSLQQKMNDQALPLVAKVRSFVDESTPKLQLVVTNVAESSELLRAQAAKIDEAVTKITDVARTQAERAGELAERGLQAAALAPGRPPVTFSLTGEADEDDQIQYFIA